MFTWFLGTNTLRSMLQLLLIKAAQAIPFVNVLEEAGAPVQKLSERVSMPINVTLTRMARPRLLFFPKLHFLIRQ